MWARTVEVMLALWLAVSGFVFRVPFERATWILALAGAAVTLTLSLLALYGPLRRAHLLLVPLGLALAVVARLSGSPPTPAEQNLIIVGVVLAMLGVIPGNASRPPAPWR